MRALILLCLSACTSSSDSTKPDTGGDSAVDSAETDTGTDPVCDTANEDCKPGTCSGDDQNMLPGADCLVCHKPGGDGPPWTFGGTIYVDPAGSGPAKNVTIRVTDSTGKTAETTSNTVGNFYSSQKLTPPFTAEVEKDGSVAKMSAEIATGGCDSCHKCDGEAGGKLYSP